MKGGAVRTAEMPESRIRQCEVKRPSVGDPESHPPVVDVDDLRLAGVDGIGRVGMTSR